MRTPPEVIKGLPPNAIDPDTATNGDGSDYTPEEFEFLAAIDNYKRHNHRPYPTWCEVLAVLRSLGWRRTDEPGPPPAYWRRVASVVVRKAGGDEDGGKEDGRDEDDSKEGEGSST